MATVYTKALNQYTGNGVSNQFNITFPYKNKSDVKVYLKKGVDIQVVLQQDVDYTFVDDETILFPKEGSQYGVLTAEDVLAFQRESEFSSEYEFSNQKRLFPEEVMNADDNLMRLVQENKRDLEKAIRIQPTSKIDSDTFFNEVDRIYQSADSVDIVAGVAGEVSIVAKEIDAVLDAPNQAQLASESARVSRVWATGSDPEVQELEEHEHSSRTYSNMAMAIANTPEDVPILESTLLATGVIKGEKGDKGDAWDGGEVNHPVTFKGDDNHPINVEGMAGATPSGIQLTDSLGAGESYFEQYNTGDRYGTKIRNKNNTTGQTVDLNLYQTNVGKSVLDLSEINTILAPQLLDVIYPVGSVYITTTATCPLEVLGVGTWELVAEDRVLQGAGTRGAVGTTVDESLPNITGSLYNADTQYQDIGLDNGVGDGAIEIVIDSYPRQAAGNVAGYDNKILGWNFDASRSSSAYQDGAPVQSDAYLVNIFRRVQ